MSVDRARLEHIKMIQKAIERMAQNSFFLRGWSVTLVTGMLAVTVAEEKRRFALLALAPAFAFWGLDAFYLRQERLFRGLHDQVCAAFGNQGPVSFSMDTGLISGVPSWFRTLFARVVFWLHGPLVFVILSVGALVHREQLVTLATCIGAALRP